MMSIFYDYTTHECDKYQVRFLPVKSECDRNSHARLVFALTEGNPHPRLSAWSGEECRFRQGDQ